MSKKIIFDRDRYRSLCAMEKNIPIFFQDWWLDNACTGGEWEVMMYVEDPHVVAIMPWFKKTKGIFTYVTMPPLTKFAGPYFLKDFPERKKHSILVKMVNAIPIFDGYMQTLHYQINNWLPFKWKGFNQTIYYSYVLPDVSDLAVVYKGISSDYRNNKFKKAADRVRIEEDLDRKKLYDICDRPFIRQGSKIPVSFQYFDNLLGASEERGQGKSFYAIDGNGVIQAAVFIVWDREATYLLLTGEYDQFRPWGSGVYTLWHAIQYANQHCPGHQFDFLGGMSEGLERTRRQFGAMQKPYHYLWKKKPFFKIVQHMFSK